MKGQGNGLIVIAFIIVVLVLFYFLWIPNGLGSGPYVPTVTFTINPSYVNIHNNSTSSIVTLQVVKTDSKNIPSQFTINLKPSVSNIHPIFASSGQTQYNYTTKTLTVSGSSDQLQFEVYGSLPPGTGSATYNITANLYYNGSIIGTQVLDVQVSK